jgi:pre-mRNA-processing factor 17
MRDGVLAAAIAADPEGLTEGRDVSAWAPARDATKPLSVDDLTAEAKEYVEWHAARREANMKARGRLKDEDGEKGAGAG